MTITIGTDCSGIEAPIQALIQLGIKHKHLWSCEIDKHARESIKANYNPETIFQDITLKRNLPKTDIYVCGFPCQPFSLAGNKDGMSDPRGTIFFDCIRAIKKSNPKIFILENVKGLLSNDNGNTMKTIIETLSKLKEYKVVWKILNTKDYGIPQNRERIYFVGLKKDNIIKEFEWSKPKKMKDIRTYVDESVRTKDDLSGYKSLDMTKFKQLKGIFIDLQWVHYINTDSYTTYSPTILAISSVWCVPMKRYATVKELLTLQGFQKTFKQVVSDRQLKKQIGNSMSVNVLKELFRCIFECIKL